MMDRLLELIDRLGSPRVFVLGDLILDRYIWGSVSRISPEAPVQILKVQREEYRVGGAANVARNLAALGARASCGGVVGADPGGRRLSHTLRGRKVDPSAILAVRGRTTPLKTRMIAHNQQMLRIDREQPHPIGPEIERRLLTVSLKAAARSDLVLLSDYDKGTLTPRLCSRLLRGVKRPVLVGLKGRDYRKYAGATGASLNRSEYHAISRIDDMDRGVPRIVRELGLEFLVLTLGEQGVRVYPKGGAPFTLPAAARQVYDVTGAGDTALAAFGLGYASGLTLEECALLANAAAGVVVAKVGTETVTRQELRAEASHGSHRHKILRETELLRALREERRRGRRIVFTNGCFDLLHAGHVSLLQHAHSKGDVLVVGLNTDRSVRALKGPGRPLLPQHDRARLLAAMEAVNYVVLFDEDTPARLVGRIRPDILVKGADYGVKEVVGRRHAGRVELAPLVRGISTSELVRRIRES